MDIIAIANNVTRLWPVPESYSKVVPGQGQPGSFWEDRQDRRHCGIDIYALHGAQVIAMESGSVLDTGVFTEKSIVHYWHKTYFVTIKSSNGLIYKYAELENLFSKKGEMVSSGDVIGRVGTVLNIAAVSEKDPPYIQALKRGCHNSMLHLEMYQNLPVEYENYLGGNLFNEFKPPNLLNPIELFQQTLTEKV